MKYAMNTLLIGLFLLTVVAVKLGRDFINHEPEGDWDWLGYFGVALSLWAGLPLIVIFLTVVANELWQSLRDGSMWRRVTDSRFIVGTLAVIGFFTLLGWLGAYMHKPVRWFIINEYSASNPASRYDPLIEGIVGGSMPWEKPSRFWLRLNNGIWEGAWISDGRKIEWSEASESMLQNADYSEPTRDY